MELQESVLTYLKTYAIKRDAKVIVACSGGRDSMCLTQALLYIGQCIELAHVNYQLRGEDSERDQHFVEQFAADNHLVCHIKKAKKTTTSDCTQTWAREERYAFFKTLSCDYIATAHHQEDQIETALIQLLRGQRLTGIPGKRDRIIRPMLACDSSMILEYVMEFAIPFREDKSNQSDAYLRNRIRHRITPLLDDIRPRARENILRTIKESLSDQEIIELSRVNWTEQYTQSRNEEIFIHIDKIPAPQRTTIVSTLCHPYGFHRKQIEQLRDAHRGAQIRAKDWLITVEQESWCIHPRKSRLTSELKPAKIETAGLTKTEYGTLDITLKTETEERDLHSDSEYVDADILSFPLIIRRWRNGDRMQPIGMKGKSKKVTDLLKESTVPSREKRNQLVLLNSDKRIIWLVGIRLSEEFKLRCKTKEIAELSWTV